MVGQRSVRVERVDDHVTSVVRARSPADDPWAPPSQGLAMTDSAVSLLALRAANHGVSGDRRAEIGGVNAGIAGRSNCDSPALAEHEGRCWKRLGIGL
jgi:hypothetical protein